MNCLKQVAWPLIGNFSCTPPSCLRASNQGWRYFLFAMGGLMMLLWAVRFFVFKLYESPKHLMVGPSSASHFRDMNWTFSLRTGHRAG
jgi:hypothetical protein